MVKLLQHPIGAGCEDKRMLCFFLWFTFIGIFRGTLSTPIADGNRRVSQRILDDSSGGTMHNEIRSSKTTESPFSSTNSAFDLETRIMTQIYDSPKLSVRSISEKDYLESLQSPTKSKSELIISNLRSGTPGVVEVKNGHQFDFRSGHNNNVKGEKRNTVIPMPRSGRSRENNLIYGSVTKKQDTVIPGIRFGRDSKSKNIVSNSVIPYPRLGRSLLSDDMAQSEVFETMVDKNNLKNARKTFNSEEEISEVSEPDDIDSRDVEDHDTVIPYPRPGRDSVEEINNFESPETKFKRQDSHYVLPQIRYGRSILLLSSPKTDSKSSKEKPQTFVLPYPRPGRSGKEESTNTFKNLQVILPYPRPGRSDAENKMDNGNKFINRQERQGYMLPNARFGRSDLSVLFDGENIMNIDQEAFLGLKVNPLVLKPDQQNSEKSQDYDDDNAVFMIPYPRPGKKSSHKVESYSKNSKSNKDEDKNLSDYVLPYPRPGKKSIVESSSRNLKDNSKENEKEPSQNFILPYPRPGRSYIDVVEKESMSDNNEMLNKDVDDTDLAKEVSYDEDFEDINDVYIRESKNYSMFPYVKFGRDYNKIFQSLNADHIDEDYNVLEEVEKSASTMENPNFSFYNSGSDFYEFNDYDSSHRRVKRSSTVVPYPRLGRSDSLIPYPRFGRSTSVIPYPRFGRSDFIVPYPRFGRSHSVVPYPRPGRSGFLVPYPQLSRSASVISYPRLSRSNSIVPYPRLGRSDFVGAYSKLSRSNSVIPYPRLGRSDTLIPYPRHLRADSMVPYPRPGRANSIVPYPRPGRSDFLVPYPRPGRSDSVVPYPRPGRSDSVVPYPRPGRSNSLVPYPRPGKSVSVVPYPRPGRSDFLVPYPRPGRSDSVVPYPRPGRSDSVVPYPRPGRANSIVTYPRPRRSDFLVPYPRPGRSDSVVPYPRPGRSNSLVPYPRPGRSDTVVPYPRPGRSDSVAPYQMSSGSNSLVSYPRSGRTSAKETFSSLEFERKAGDEAMQVTKPGRLNSKEYETYILPYPRPGRSESHLETKKESRGNVIPYPRMGRSSKNSQGFIIPQYRFGRSGESKKNENETSQSETVIPYPRLGRSQKQVTPLPDMSNSIHKMNKHMLSSSEDSIYILPYPRPGRYSQ